MTSSADKPPYYITTAISYPNGVPHIGHAYEFIATDAMARFKRLDGYDVCFLTGTDEHGQKMLHTAEKEGITPLALAKRNSDVFQATQDGLGISYDRFIRTTDEDHYAAAQAIWKRMEDAGDIYLDKYEGWYSVRDEAYYGEDETEVREDGKRYSIQTDTEVTWTEEESYFFRLSAYQDKLLKLYEDQPEFAAPRTRFNEVISFVKHGLMDLSISRTTFDWGIPVPGNPKHVMYVWVDALTNYLTGVGFPDTEADAFRKWWPADVHVIGKDISRFHAIYWPAFLMSAGLELPKRVMIHGHLHNNGVKMSKSLGNFRRIRDTVAPEGLADEESSYVANPREAEMLRFFIVRNHYRSLQNYAPDNLRDAQQALDRLYQTLQHVPAADVQIDWTQGPALAFAEAMNDDFNTAGAIAVLFELAGQANRDKDAQAAGLMRALGGVIGLLQVDPAVYWRASTRFGQAASVAGADSLSDTQIDELLAERSQAKQNRDFARADAIREQLKEQGVELEDRPGGATQWRRA